MPRYTVPGRPMNHIDVDGVRSVRCADPVHFEDAVTMLRWAIRDGGMTGHQGGGRIITTSSVYLGQADDPWRHQRLATATSRWTWSLELVDAMMAAQRRIHAIRHQLREIDPGWVTVQHIYYADNSEVDRQVAVDGRTREVMTKWPSGDLCF